MSRAQCIVHRDNKVLMVKHRHRGVEWWCLPGGAIEDEESPQEAALRELMEECSVEGKVVRQTSFLEEADGTHAYTFLIDIGSQEPRLGFGPEFRRSEQIIIDLKWLGLSEIPERDRAFLWAAGLLSIDEFLEEVVGWGESTSYPE
jgi:8-oxo-dGTP pyrophosphatase MutT (NUDIX family)